MVTVFNKRIAEIEDGGFGLWVAGSLTCFSIEKPYLNNKNNISSIPLGVYQCAWTFSNRLQKYTYEILNVPNRGGIRIHSANEPHELLGCIALCSGVDIGKIRPGIYGTNSHVAVDKFERVLNKEPFLLKITNLS